MTGTRYYLTTIAALHRHASRCAETHFVTLDSGEGKGSAFFSPAANSVQAAASMNAAAPILALVSADEAAHMALESDAEFEPLPHTLARTPVSERVAAALAHFGVTAGDATFTVAEKLARVHPLMRHRVF